MDIGCVGSYKKEDHEWLNISDLLSWCRYCGATKGGFGVQHPTWHGKIKSISETQDLNRTIYELKETHRKRLEYIRDHVTRFVEPYVEDPQ